MKHRDTETAPVLLTLSANPDETFVERIRTTTQTRTRNLLTHYVVIILPLSLGWGTEAMLSNLLLLSVLVLYATTAIVATHRINTRPQTEPTMRLWGNSMYLQVALLGFLYNLIFFNLHLHGVEKAMLYGLLTLSLFSAGAVTSYHQIRFLGQTFVICAMVPQVIYYLSLGTEDGRFFAFLITAFIVFISSVGIDIHKNALRTLILNQKLKAAREEAERMAMTDELSGLGNRRAFFEWGNVISSAAGRYGHTTSMMMIDIDNFKTINDTYGHAVGDKVIVALAKTLREDIRDSDIIGRIGGDEFAIAMPETRAQKSCELAERLRQHIGDITVSAGDTDIGFSVSIGVAESNDRRSTIDELLSRADYALYQAKATGRNRTINYSVLPEGIQAS